MRITIGERELLAAIARRLERTESDTVRFLLREKARTLGILTLRDQKTTPDEKRTNA